MRVRSSFVQNFDRGLLPVINAYVPQTKPTAGEQIKFVASAVDDNVDVGLVSDHRKDLSGQGTREIVVDILALMVNLLRQRGNGSER
jgi:hypothetical protein